MIIILWHIASRCFPQKPMSAMHDLISLYQGQDSRLRGHEYIPKQVLPYKIFCFSLNQGLFSQWPTD